ncbi:hypothetical protein ACFE04_030833 [Oxalis oulophora]
MGQGLELELCTIDRVGLLSAVTRIFRENSLTVTRAEMTTKAGKAVNTFYVSDASGYPVKANGGQPGMVLCSDLNLPPCVARYNPSFVEMLSDFLEAFMVLYYAVLGGGLFSFISDGKYILMIEKLWLGVPATIHGLVVWLLIHTALYRTQMTMESHLYSGLVLSVRYLHRAITIVYAFRVENIVFKHDEKSPNVMGTVAYVGPEYIQTGD